jgi:hypothetical protein
MQGKRYELEGQASPIFIVGSYRSGTSAATWALGQHYNIWNIPESYWFTRFCADLDYYYRLGTYYPRAHLSVCGVCEEQFLAFWRKTLHEFINMAQMSWLKKQYYFMKTDTANEIPKHLTLLNAPHATKLRWVDGTPENSHYVDVFHRVFPNAKFIHLFRHPDEVVLSLVKMKEIGGGDYTIESAFEAWYRLSFSAFRAEKALGSKVVRRFPTRIMRENPEETVRKMLGFAGENYEASCLDPLKHKLNSSHVKADVDLDKLHAKIKDYNKPIARKSRELFEELNTAAPFAPDESVMAEIAQERSQYYENRRRV